MFFHFHVIQACKETEREVWKVFQSLVKNENMNKLRVSDQNGISLQSYIVEIYHSGRKPLK